MTPDSAWSDERPAWRLLAQLAPSAFYTQLEDHLRITSFNSLTGVELQVRTRWLLWDGRRQAGSDRHVPNTDRTAATTFIPAPDGWLLGCEVIATVAAPRVGQCFVVVDVVRGSASTAFPLHTLVQGYVTDTSRLAYPGSPIAASIAGPGVLRSITGTDPAAGAEVSETVPTNARWRPLALTVALVTAVAAANREVSLVLDDGANIYARVPSGFTQVASLTRTYSTFHHAPRNTIAQDNTLNFPLPRLDMQGGHRIRTVTTNLQAGDDFGAPQLLVEEWIED